MMDSSLSSVMLFSRSVVPFLDFVVDDHENKVTNDDL
jgi:hypothetical protein